jgi:hypothetical protein
MRINRAKTWPAAPCAIALGATGYPHAQFGIEHQRVKATQTRVIVIRVGMGRGFQRGHQDILFIKNRYYQPLKTVTLRSGTKYERPRR